MTVIARHRLAGDRPADPLEQFVPTLPFLLVNKKFTRQSDFRLRPTEQLRGEHQQFFPCVAGRGESSAAGDPRAAAAADTGVVGKTEIGVDSVYANRFG